MLSNVTLVFLSPTFTYTLRRNARSNHMRIAIKGDGTCVVTVPKRVSAAEVDRLVQKKAVWIKEALENLKQNPRPYSWVGTTAELKKFKSSAMRLAKDRLLHFNKVYGFRVVSVGIRNQKSRWGSCSSAGRLNFSYKIALLPPHLADYIIVHELCHLGEMNHSLDFWRLVEKTIPDYKARRAELRA